MTALPFDASVPVPVPVEETEKADSLQQRLAERLSALRRRSSGPLSVERRIALGGGMLAAAGAVLVLLGWYGASHTSRVYLQIPYLISGGLLGVVLAVAGGSAYLASWMTRLVQDQQARSDDVASAAREMTATLERIEALLAASSLAAAPASPAAPAASSALVATPSGKLAHQPSCPTVAGRDDLRSVTADDGLAPCRMCNSQDL
ncbi:MAG: hypothetical protein ACOYXM_05900 [Actinomycetota bacterium]